jgi:hypothetical protein
LPSGVKLTEARSATPRVPDELVQVITAEGIVVLAIMQRCFVLPLQRIRMLVVVILFKLVLGRNSVAVKTVAARRSTTGAVLAVVVLLGLIRTRSGRRSLDITEMGVHGHALANLWDALLILNLGSAFAGRKACASLLLDTVARGRTANAERSGLVRVGAGDGLDALLGAVGRKRRLGGMELQIFGDGASVFR